MLDEPIRIPRPRRRMSAVEKALFDLRVTLEGYWDVYLPLIEGQTPIDPRHCRHIVRYPKAPLELQCWNYWTVRIRGIPFCDLHAPLVYQYLRDPDGI